jgi:hypothetical protein
VALMTWTDRLSVGVGVIDDDHKKLVGMVNELYEAMQAGHGKEKLAASSTSWCSTPNSISRGKRSFLPRQRIRPPARISSNMRR